MFLYILIGKTFLYFRISTVVVDQDDVVSRHQDIFPQDPSRDINTL